MRSFLEWLQGTRFHRSYSHFIDVGGSVLAAGMGYQALFAVFAALWLGFAVFGSMLAERPELLQIVVVQINLAIPGLISDDHHSLVSAADLVAVRALSWTSVVAAISLIWVATNWFTGTRRSLRLIFGLDVTQYRNEVLLKLRDFVLTVLFAFALLVSTALTAFSSHLTDAFFAWFAWDRGGWLFGTVGVLVRYAAVFVFDGLVLMAIFRYLAEARVPRLRLLRGCLVGGAALFGLKVLGAALLWGSTGNPLLTSFALFVGVLLWFHFVCRVLLLTAAWIATGVDARLGLPQTQQCD